MAMDRRSFNRRLMAGGAVAATGVTSLSVASASSAAPAPTAAAAGPKRAPAGGKVHHLTMVAERVGTGKIDYGFEKGKATVPGPLIDIVEGDTVHIEFTNLTDVDASLHVHGVDYDIANDGTRMNKSHVPPGGKRTYTWRTHKPGKRADGTYREGSAGYWHYHDHVVGTDHGTGGIKQGLYGGLVVRREGDILPDKQFTIVFNDMQINNLPGAESPNFEATVGERLEVVMITHGEFYHTFHIHGHRWADNRTGLLSGAGDTSRIVDNKLTGPADSFGLQIIAGEGVGAGAWMYHCHVQSHSDGGMAGLFLIAKPDGTVPGYEPHHPEPAKSAKGTSAQGAATHGAAHAGH